MAEEKNLFNPHNGLTGRDGGPYLDQEERRLAEIVRAAKEDREPDFENAPATAGTPLVDANTLVAMANPASNPSKANQVDAMTNAVELLAHNEDFPATPHSSRPLTEVEIEANRLAESTNPHDNPANPTVISVDDKATSESTKGVISQDEPKADADKSDSKKSDDFGSPGSSDTKKTAAKKTAASPSK